MNSNIYDSINFIICFGVTVFCAMKCDFSKKVLFLLLLHLLLVAFIDLGLSYHYMPDQFRYLIATQELRHHFRTSEPSTIKYTGIFFAIFPLFIVSVKSIAYINYLIYLWVFVFILRELEDKNLALFFKAFYLCYPSLILYSSLGLRDILILFLMLMSLYCGLINFKKIFLAIALGALFLIKPQNAIVVFLTIYIKKILRLRPIPRIIFFLILLTGCFLFINKFGILLEYYRAGMYEENTSLPKELVPRFNYFDSFSFLIKPFILTAKNDLQIIQSCENILLFFPLVMIVYIRIINKQFWSYCYLEFMLLSSCIIYSYVVFNYGTLTRYKFPFIVCYVVMNLIQLDIKIKTTKLKIT